MEYQMFIHENSNNPGQFIGGIAPRDNGGGFFGGTPITGGSPEEVQKKLEEYFKSSNSYQPGDVLHDINGKLILRKGN